MERSFADRGERYSHERIPEMDKNLRFYLKKEIRNYGDVNPQEIIAKIEALSQENTENPKEELLNILLPIFGEKTQMFVNRLFGYQKRMCRDNGFCKRLGCYFKHTVVGLPMMEIDERPALSAREERLAGGNKALLEKQRRIVEILCKRTDLPPDVKPLVEQLKRLMTRGRGGSFAAAETSTRFVINNRQEWMTSEHLQTYPGVVSVTEEGMVVCATRADAERVFNMIYKIDPNSHPEWIDSS